MIIKREELYETLKKICPGKYSVGLHGISLSRVQDFYGLDISLPEVISTATAKQIVENGLRVESARTINGTVAFMGRLDDPDSLEKTFKELASYRYGSDKDYIIVATPVEIECEDGRTLYVGATNLNSKYKRYFDTTGNETTTVLDKIILSDKSIIKPRFILGRFKKLNDEEIELDINPEHLSQTGKKFTSEEYENYVKCLRYSTYSPVLYPLLKKDLVALRDSLYDLDENLYTSAYLIETIEQLLREDQIREFSEEDLKRLAELKQRHRQILEDNKRYEEEQQQKLERMANYTIDEIREFALNNHPTYFQNFPDSIKNNIELMRELTKTPGLNSFIVYYLGPNVRNDSEAMINLVNNCRTSNFPEYFNDDIWYDGQLPNKSDLGYDTIGLDVRTNPLFWESLNTRILEINKEEEKNYPYFDTEKEVRLATELKAKKTQK